MLEDLLKPGLELWEWHGAGLALHLTTTSEDGQGRNSAHAELLRGEHIIFGVDLNENRASAKVTGRALKRRREGATGTAPRSPEIDDHRKRGAFDKILQLLRVRIQDPGV